MGRFADDIKANLGYTGRVWWRWTLGMTVASVLVCLFFNITDPGSKSDVATLILLVVGGLIYCGVYSAIVAAVIAILALTHRLVGMAFLIPVIVIPLSLYLVFWLGSGWLDRIVSDMLLAMKAASGLPDSLQGIRVHGFEEAIVVLAMLLFVYAFQFLTTWPVLSEILMFLAVSGLYTVMALVIGLSVSTPPLLVALGMRYRKRIAENGQV